MSSTPGLKFQKVTEDDSPPSWFPIAAGFSFTLIAYLFQTFISPEDLLSSSLPFFSGKNPYILLVIVIIIKIILIM